MFGILICVVHAFGDQISDTIQQYLAKYNRLLTIELIAIDTIDYRYTPNICLSLCSNTCTFKWLSFNFRHAVSLSYLFKNIKRYTSILYNREDLMKKAGNISRKNLLSMGTCFGKMTKAGKFRLQITALDFMAPYAKV